MLELSVDAPDATDVGNALRFVKIVRGRLLYVPELATWLHYDGRRWTPDIGDVMTRQAAKEVSRVMLHEAADLPREASDPLIAHARRSRSLPHIRAMIDLARDEPDMHAALETFDTDPWALCVPNGVIDLRTGTLRDHDPAERHTQLAPVAFARDAVAPRWVRFLDEVFEGDDDLIGFVQRAVGYSLTGSVRERALFILWGTGRNGKTTLVEILATVLGDYAVAVAVTALLRSRHAGANVRDAEQVGRLRGRRFAITGESERGDHLAEARVKLLVGNDTLTGAELHRATFSFQPSHKLWIATNHRPAIDGGDVAIVDRLRLIPFARRFSKSEEDPSLPATLWGERTGILAWAVAGAVAWHRDGLGHAKAVTKATEDYRAAHDTVGRFLEDRCQVQPDVSVGAADLNQSFETWCASEDVAPLDPGTFGERLRDRGYSKRRGSGGLRWHGLTLLRDEPFGARKV